MLSGANPGPYLIRRVASDVAEGRDVSVRQQCCVSEVNLIKRPYICVGSRDGVNGVYVCDCGV